MFEWVRKGVSYINDKLNKPLEKRSDNLNWLTMEVTEWLASKERHDQIAGDDYYNSKHAIMNYKRMVIGKDGKETEVTNLPNKRIIDNQYKKLVNQKTNHIVGKPFTVDSNDGDYVKVLEKNYFNKRFYKLLKKVVRDAQNGGISYIYPYYENNILKFRHLKSYNVKVYWKDDDHDEIDFFWHYYKEDVRLPNGQKDLIEHLEVYTADGVSYYIRKGEALFYDYSKGENAYNNYLTFTQTNSDGAEHTEKLTFERFPLVPVRVDETEKPLLNRVKSLQDGINTILSTFTNNMLEDPRNTIMVLVNYDGQDLGEFREKLALYGAVKVRSREGGGGDVKTLSVEVNAENYKLIVELFKKAIIQNGGGVDVTELKNGNPNQMNIQSMYYDLELDTNDLETELHCAFEQLLWFINFDMGYKGVEKGVSAEEVNIIFNRDMMQDETTIIKNIMELRGLISDEDCIKLLPFGDAQQLIENMKKQKAEEQAEQERMYFNNPKPNLTPNKDGDALNE